MRDEFLRMLHEMELGVTRISALRNMALRVQIKEFTSFVSAIELGTELGSPLTETMESRGRRCGRRVLPWRNARRRGRRR